MTAQQQAPVAVGETAPTPQPAATTIPAGASRDEIAERFASVLSSDAPVALVVQGGGMRGTYSIAALAAFEDAGLGHRFTDIYGTSAGALNGAYFLAGQATTGVRVYVDRLSNTRFINPRRPGKVIDIDYLVDDVLSHQAPLDVAAVQQSPTRLHIGATATTTGDLTWFHNDGQAPLLEALRATAALPIVYGREVVVGAGTYVDGGLRSTVPLLTALDQGHQDVVVVLTRPVTYLDSAAGLLGGALMRGLARAKRHSPTVVAALGKTDPTFVRALELIRAGTAAGAPRVWVVAPTQPIASRLTTDRNVLAATAACGYRDATALLSSYLAHRPQG